MNDRKHWMYPDKTASAEAEAVRYQFEVWAARHFGVSDASKTCWAGYRWNTYVDGVYFATDLQTAWLSWKEATAQAMAAVQGPLLAVVSALAQDIEPNRLRESQQTGLNSRVPADLEEIAEVGCTIGSARAGTAVKAPPAPKVLGDDGYCVGCDCWEKELDPCVWADAAQRVKIAEQK